VVRGVGPILKNFNLINNGPSEAEIGLYFLLLYLLILLILLILLLILLILLIILKLLILLLEIKLFNIEDDLY